MLSSQSPHRFLIQRQEWAPVSFAPVATTANTGIQTGALDFVQNIAVIHHCVTNHPRPQGLKTTAIYVAYGSVGWLFGLDSAGPGHEFVMSSCSGRLPAFGVSQLYVRRWEAPG